MCFGKIFGESTRLLDSAVYLLYDIQYNYNMIINKQTKGLYEYTVICICKIIMLLALIWSFESIQ